MTHKTAVNTSDRGPRNAPDTCTCEGELVEGLPVFHSDVQWTRFRCAACGKLVFTVGGRRHHWNYDREPNEAKAAP
jgi:hypothetical protein